VTDWHGPDGEPTLADVQREFPGWECWRGTSGLYYARRCTRPRNHSYDVQGEDPLDLRDMIRGWIGRNTEHELPAP
jgi:hypothetical protein